MFAPLMGAVRADLDRQIGWAKEEVGRQARHAMLVGILLGAAALAAFGAATVALIALYMWLAQHYGAFISLAVIGGGLFVLALILLLLALIRRRPRLAARPPLQMAQPATVLETLAQDSYAKAVAGGEQAARSASDALREGSRSALLGTLALAVVLGLIAGRKLGR
jgi:hypothetical protein